MQRAAVPAAQEVAGGAQNGPLPRETRCRTFAVVESGDTLATKGIAGLTTGCPTKNVKFRVPLNEFVRIFAGLAFETDAPNE